MKETVLVSGGAGYIGTHTAVALIEAGYDVVMIDNFSNSEPSAVLGVEMIVGRKVTFEEVDTCDINALRGVFERHDFNTVIHFAAYKAVGESMTEPLKYYMNNLVSYMNILELMKEFKRPNVLFSSSATVYGTATVLPVTEQPPRQPAPS
ncbi:MAG: GDP-mannose 4,6-dehydratase, partial [Muribaculaceae bacterium]|nr:GDP-mannose 4,6-dehydratase [Muribaculaceae bacterium]